MVLFDRFKKKEERSVEKPVERPGSVVNNANSNLSVDHTTLNGVNVMRVIDYSPMAQSNQFYDTTCLMIVESPSSLPSGKSLYDAYVSWYGIDDAVNFRHDGSEIKGRKDDFKSIRLNIDFDALETDEAYRNMLMNGLLSKERVERYLHDSITGVRSTGNYIGEVRDIDGVYKKYFDESLGREVHDLPDQARKRQEYYKMQQDRKQEEIARKREEIRRAQAELDDLEKY